MNNTFKLILGLSFLISSNFIFAQAAAPSKPAVSPDKVAANAAEIESMKKKTLANIESIKKNVIASKKFLDDQEENYKGLMAVSSLAARKKVCHETVKAEIKSSGAIQSSDKKENEKAYDDKWVSCLEEKREKFKTLLNDSARIVWDAREDYKKIQMVLISAIKYYNAIPGVKALSVPTSPIAAPAGK